MEKKKKSIEDFTISLKPSSLNDLIGAMDQENKSNDLPSIEEQVANENLANNLPSREKKRKEREEKENEDLKESIQSEESEVTTKKIKEELKEDSKQEETKIDERIIQDEKVEDNQTVEETKENKVDEEFFGKDNKKLKKVKEPKTLKQKIFSQFTFKLISILFWVGCMVFYGSRLVHYYKVFNPKTANGETLTSLGSTVKQDNPVVSKKDGFYNVSGSFFFKGTEVNNYVMYSNQLWRIVRVNSDNTVQLITDSSVNDLVWGNESKSFNKSYIYEWLNSSKEKYSGVFEKILNNPDEYLVKSIVCEDKINDLKNVTCEKAETIGYVTLLGINEYANTINKDSFVNNANDIWLNNTTSDGKVWYISKGAIENDEQSKGYAVKPVITIKNTVTALSGNGTKEKPYIIEKEKTKPAVGDVVEINDIKYTIYEISKDFYRVVASELVNKGDTTYKFSSSENKFDPTEKYSLAYHLNNTLYGESTTDLLEECEWYIGSYTKENNYDYKNIYSETLKGKIGLYNVSDIKFNINSEDYYYLTPGDDGTVYGYNKYQNLYSMKPTYMKSIRPALCLKSSAKFAGKGTIDDPYKVGE